MINIRKNIFETNSSSSHSLTIIPNDIYEKWRNHEITIRFEDSDIDIGGGDDGFLQTWGNFFVHQDKIVTCDISETKNKNLEILKPYLSLNISGKLKKSIEDYKINGIITPPLFIEDLYLTPEEYKESLEYDDVDSPFLYKGGGVVVIGTYYRS